MALIGYTTKTDLTSIGKYLFMALIGLIIATLVNMFIKSEGFTYILSYIGVLIFVGLTAYDSQKIKQMLLQAPDAGEGAQKIALLGALTLYLDFINLFLYLLRIFGRRDWFTSSLPIYNKVYKFSYCHEMRKLLYFM